MTQWIRVEQSLPPPSLAALLRPAPGTLWAGALLPSPWKRASRWVSLLNTPGHVTSWLCQAARQKQSKR